MSFYPTERSCENLCPQAGAGREDGGPLVAPLIQSTTFCRDGVGSDAEYQYSRVANPTVSALENVLGELEEAAPAVCFATGLAAETALFLALLKSGDHLVLGRAVYGGTTRLARRYLAPLGIETTFVDSTRPDEIAAAVRPTTRLIFIETPANPTLEVTDIATAAAIARSAGVPLAVDNTFLTSVLQQPLDLGADVSVYSTTKFVDGHSVAPGGALVTRDAELRQRLHEVRKATGAIQTPWHAWLTLQGLKTLPLRLERQSDSAAFLAERLAEHPAIERVAYPTLRSPELAERQHRGRHGAVLSLEVAGGLEAARRFAAAVRLCRLVEHVGSVETLLTHPASMTHAEVPAEQRRAAGITDGLVRLSVGLENPESILADLEQALARAVDRAVTGGAA